MPHFSTNTEAQFSGWCLTAKYVKTLFVILSTAYFLT